MMDMSVIAHEIVEVVKYEQNLSKENLSTFLHLNNWLLKLSSDF